MNHSIVLSTVSSLRITDTRAAFGALPAARRRWENCRMTGFQRVASKALRTDVRPPQMVRSLRNRPLSRLKGTTPTTSIKPLWVMRYMFRPLSKLPEPWRGESYYGE